MEHSCFANPGLSAQEMDTPAMQHPRVHTGVCLLLLQSSESHFHCYDFQQSLGHPDSGFQILCSVKMREGPHWSLSNQAQQAMPVHSHLPSGWINGPLYQADGEGKWGFGDTKPRVLQPTCIFCLCSMSTLLEILSQSRIPLSARVCAGTCSPRHHFSLLCTTDPLGQQRASIACSRFINTLKPF